ncbi:hypothetical protein T03_17736 [Trichinella britovi]|uniref:Uncharacterized protein n=1 Tax=Trichinella britovi TaxID=45882 RepID=A0A0V1AIY9_TRIBR|nr:hypothetical protein T03_17736 [Trichinella britovi]
MGSLEQPESLLSPGYRCYFYDGVAATHPSSTTSI